MFEEPAVVAVPGTREVHVEDPVDPAVLDSMLQAALRAPSAGNTAGTSWVILEGAAETALYWESTTDQAWRATSARSPGLRRAPVILLAYSSAEAYVARYAEPDKAASGPGDAAGPALALDAAEFNEDDGVSEVRLSFAGNVGVGRAGSGPLIGGAEATLDALRDLGNVIPFYLMGVTKVDTMIGCSVIVALRSLSANDDRMGIALAHDDLLAAAKATLDALNRYLSMDPARRHAAAGEIGAGAGAGGGAGHGASQLQVE